MPQNQDPILPFKLGFPSQQRALFSIILTPELNSLVDLLERLRVNARGLSVEALNKPDC